MTKRSTLPGSELTDAWIEYLRSSEVCVRDFWEALIEHIGEHILPPYGAPLESGRFAMIWDRGDHHFEIEILPYGTYDWFYMDRSSAARSGEEQQPLSVCSPEMIRVLAITLRE